MGRFRSKSVNIKRHRQNPVEAPYAALVPIDPPYPQRGLVNLVAEIEGRLIGASIGQGLAPEVGGLIPHGRSYVLVVFDGLGVAQLGHPDAARMLESSRATLESPFPTTTSVALATIATGLPVGDHGLIAHLTWFPELDRVVNTLKWVDLAGKQVRVAYGDLLPRPNLWERLRAGGVEPITVQPSAFSGSPLSRLLYRGCRFEAAWDDQDLVEATVALAAEPGRLVLTYFWQVDYAGHVSGLGSSELGDAMRSASRIWDDLASRLPSDVVLVGTADHGLIEYAEEDKILVRGAPFDTLRYAGDPRGVHLWGEDSVMAELAAATGGELVDPLSLYGPDPIPSACDRSGQALLLAPEGKVILPPGFDKRLRAYHGGLGSAEREVPLLVG